MYDTSVDSITTVHSVAKRVVEARRVQKLLHVEGFSRQESAATRRRVVRATSDERSDDTVIKTRRRLYRPTGKF